MKPEELPNFPFPLFLESEDLDDRYLKQKLPLELFLQHEGHEVVLGEDKRRFVLSISDYPDFPRDALKLDITTYRGSPSNAIHFYGKLVLPFIQFMNCETGDFKEGYRIPGVLRTIELHRRLTKREILEDKDRYRDYEAGWMIAGFNTPGHVTRRAGIVMKTYFPGFKLVISRHY